MKKSIKNFYSSKKNQYSLLGCLICLFAIFGALNRGIVSNFLSWTISFLFGWLFYIVYLLIFILGLHLIIKTKLNKKSKILIITSIILLFVGFLILITNNLTLEKDDKTVKFLIFDDFIPYIKNHSNLFPKINYSVISGGFFGLILTASLNTLFKNYVVTNSIGLVLFLIGFGLLTYKFIYKFIIFIKNLKKKKIQERESLYEDQIDRRYLSNTRSTTVITPDNNISKENTQTIAIQNPLGGIGIGVTSITRNPKGLRKAEFNPNENYGANDEQTELIVPDNFNDDNDTLNNNSEVMIAKKASFNKEQMLESLNNKKVVNKNKPYVSPSLNLLNDFKIEETSKLNFNTALERQASINQILEDYKIKAVVKSFTIGPTVTRFDIETEKGQSTKAIQTYLNDINSKLGGVNCRFVPVVEGKVTSALEIANPKSSLVTFKDCIENLKKSYQNDSKCLVSFGKGIVGNYVEDDLNGFPHLLVSGTTGSGKSIFMHTLIMSLIMLKKPSEVKFVIIDPKKVEFRKYDDIPFLACPTITEADEAYLTLVKLVDIMEERFELLSKYQTQNIAEYNKYCTNHNMTTLPRIVVVIDEYADLIESNDEISKPVVRIAQKARAAGIHLVLATQRPTTNVITGVIKSNIPTRVALAVQSNLDSQIIINTAGAEKLLGHGDMLVVSRNVSKYGEPVRVQGSYIENNEISRVCEYLKENYDTEYEECLLNLKDKSRIDISDNETMTYDKIKCDEEKYYQIRDDVMHCDYVSISYLQRLYNLGFSRASNFFNRLKDDGVISKEPFGNKGCKVLMKAKSSQADNKGSIEQSYFIENKNI